MSDLNGPTDRRRFLESLVAGAATLGIATVAAPLRLTAQQKGAASKSGSSSFDAWLGKIKGKHRQVFDSMMPDSGFPLAWARIFLMTNKAVGVPDNDCTAVVVLRHDSIPFAMEDRLWAKYKFGEIFKINDSSTKMAAVKNMFWKPKPGDLPIPGMGVNELLDSGVLVGVCDMALTFYSKHVATDLKIDPEECKKDWVAGVFPGIEIVPSGVLAVNRAQEHGCTYCWAG